MTHYTMLVARKDESESLDDILEPYNENREVEPYEQHCSCDKYSTNTDAREIANQRYGKTLEQLRVEHDAILDNQPTWQEFIAGWSAIYEEARRAHPLWEKPDPECEDCNGTGVCKSTYNPASKWDWWQVGGRWSGTLLLKNGVRVDEAKVRDIDFEAMREEKRQRAAKRWDEAEAWVKWGGLTMPKYLELCGKEDRAEARAWHETLRQKYAAVQQRKATAGGFAAIEVDQMEMPATDWFDFLWFEAPKPGTTREKYMDDNALDCLTHGFVDLEGKWNEDGKMGWWGIQLTENAGFPEIYEGWLMQMQAEHPDAILTCIDCHI
jgi:hypothetical protein